MTDWTNLGCQLCAFHFSLFNFLQTLDTREVTYYTQSEYTHLRFFFNNAFCLNRRRRRRYESGGPEMADSPASRALRARHQCGSPP